MFYGKFLLIRQKPSPNRKGFEKRHSCGLMHCHIISKRWKLNKWQIIALASPQSLGGIWMLGRNTSFRKPTPVLRWPASHTHTHIMLCLETQQQISCSHAQQTQKHIGASLPLSVVGECQTMESRSSLTGLHFNIALSCLKYLVLEQELSVWTLTPGTGHLGSWHSSDRP